MSSYQNNIRKSRPSSSYARPRSVYSSPSRSGSSSSAYSSLGRSSPSSLGRSSASLGLSSPYLSASSSPYSAVGIPSSYSSANIPSSYSSANIPSSYSSANVPSSANISSSSYALANMPSSPYSAATTYGGTASGYGGLTVTPSSPSYAGAYSRSARSAASSPSSRQSSLQRSPLKRNYYQTAGTGSPLARFDSSASLASNKSYGSEGYVVRTRVYMTLLCMGKIAPFPLFSWLYAFLKNCQSFIIIIIFFF